MEASPAGHHQRHVMRPCESDNMARICGCWRALFSTEKHIKDYRNTSQYPNRAPKHDVFKARRDTVYRCIDCAIFGPVMD